MTGNPIVDWILTIISAIGVVLGALLLLKGTVRKLVTADGPEEPPPFGRRADDLRILNEKHGDLERQVDDHETKIIVLETKEKTTAETIAEVKRTIETNRVEQRATNRQLFDELGKHQSQMSKMDRDARDRHDEIKTLLLQIKTSNGGG